MISINHTDGTVTVSFKDRLDSSNADDILNEILQKLENEEFDNLCFDLAQLNYISSAGLRLFLSVKRRYENLQVLNVNAAVYDVFFITGMNGLFGIKPPKNYLNESQIMDDIYSSHTTNTSLPNNVKDCTVHADIPLEGINDTTEQFTYKSVIDMFSEQVKRHPEKIAVVSPDASLTYAQLDALSNKVANVLIFEDVMPDDVIMVMLPRSVDVYIATLGILKAGAAYTIVNVKYPDERIEYIYNDAGCKFMISNNPTVMDRLELIADVIKKRPLFMESLLSYSDSSAPDISIASDSLCYLIYTSGSTGTPKGVMIEHGNLSNFVYPTEKNYEANGITQKGSVLLAMAQMTFDVSVMEQYLGLTSGMTVALVTENEILDPSAMKDFLLKNHVDAVCFTPAYANTLVNIPDMHEAIKGIVTYDFGAEAFPGNLFTKIRAINPDAYIMNGYGPTEATISCTMKVIDSPDDITIGKPNANVYVFVVDEKLNEVPKGELGELLICGLGVGRGYCNLPDKTAEVFVNFKGMRGYRTGDLVCINENDEIEFHGRRDNQVKLRGLRIELDEVEKVIASHPAVKNCAAKVFDNRILVGYYELSGDSEVSPDEIKEYAKSKLAHYMIPDVFMQIEEMPLTANNKIARKELPRPQLMTEECVPPANDVQAQIIGIIKDITGEENIGITTNIIDLGLSSLDTMILVARLEEKFSVQVKFADIYDNPTAEKIEEMINSKPKIVKKEARSRYRCFSTIASAYQLIKEDPTSTQWNLPYIYTTDLDKVDVNRFKNAVIKALKAHPGLWAGFTGEDDTVYMIPSDIDPDYDIPVYTLSEEEFEERKKNLVRPLPLDGSEQFRAEIFITQSRLYLFLDISHLIIDGESYDILLEDINRAYCEKELNTESYTVFNVLDEQADFIEGGGKETAIEYYENLFASSGLNSFFHLDKEEVPVKTARYDCRLPVSREKIQSLIKAHRISENVLFMGLISACIAADNNGRSIYFPVAYNGRTNSRAQSTIGFLAQMYFVLSTWEPDTTVLSYLQSIQKQIIYPMGFASQPYLEMLGRYPELLTFAFSFIGESGESYPLGESSMLSEALSPEGSGGLYRMFCEIKIKDNEYICSMEYRSNELNEDSVIKAVGRFEAMLKDLDPGIKMDELVTVSER